MSGWGRKGVSRRKANDDRWAAGYQGRPRIEEASDLTVVMRKVGGGGPLGFLNRWATSTQPWMSVMHVEAKICGVET